MDGSVTVSMAAPADKIWDLIADVRNTGKFSPEVLEAEWLDGATGPALGARVPRARQAQRDRAGVLDDVPGHRLRAGTRVRLRVLVGDKAVNNWHYRLTPADGGTDVTESFRMPDSSFTKLFSVLGGQLRRRRNIRDMRKTLERIKAVVEAPESA